MKIDRLGVDAGQLARLVRERYGRRIVTLAFLPKGEEARSANYVAADDEGNRFLLKLRAGEDAQALRARYEVVRAVHECGLRQVVAPLRARDGALSCRLDAHDVLVFPFVEGVSVWDAGGALDAAGWAAAAALIAALHASAEALDPALLAGLPREEFANPFRAPILRALEVAEAPGAAPAGHGRRLRDLLVAERDDLVATLDRVERVQPELAALATERVLTHGDPNLANLVVDPEGRLHLIDWSDLALGPPERDLWMFVDKPDDVFLRRYLAVHGPAPLHGRLFAFYQYRWALQEVADYATRIQSPDSDEGEREHAWNELQPYLPIPHRRIQDAVAAAEAAVWLAMSTRTMHCDAHDPQRPFH